MNTSSHAKSLNFREAAPADIPLLNQLIRDGKAYWGYPEDGLERFMKVFTISDPSYFKNSFGFIATSNNEVIGQYLFKTDASDPVLDYFFLNTQFIRQGYGRFLWEHCIEEVRKKGLKEFTFWADPYALGFYEHMGAVKITERPMITAPGLMAPIMKFSLEARKISF